MKDEKIKTAYDELIKNPSIPAPATRYMQNYEFFKAGAYWQSSNKKESALPSEIDPEALCGQYLKNAFELDSFKEKEVLFLKHAFVQGATVVKNIQSSEIEALKAEIKELKDRMEWISVSDKLPEIDQEILAYEEGSGIQQITYTADTDWVFTTHWMPLPLPPTKNK